MENVTPGLLYLAHYFGGAFVANALPHLGAGILGQPLQTPFASPPDSAAHATTTVDQSAMRRKAMSHQDDTICVR